MVMEFSKKYFGRNKIQYILRVMLSCHKMPNFNCMVNIFISEER